MLTLLGSVSAAPAEEGREKILITTDIHFNPLADPTLAPQLVAADPQQWQSILDRSQQTAYSQYGQDTNWWLLRSALNAMQATLPHPAIIMVSGDLLAHGFPQKFTAATHDDNPEHYRAFVLKTFSFLARQVQARFPQQPVLVTPGNNDDDCGDYAIEAGGRFLGDTAGLVQQLAQSNPEALSEIKDQWQALGSYEVRPLSLPNLRVLSLNTVFFSNRYPSASAPSGCGGAGGAAATRTLAWLEAQLASAEAAHQKVWLLLHIPPGIDGYSSMMKFRQLLLAGASTNLCRDAVVPLWKPEWAEKFVAITDRYQATITAGFAGHDHTDDFRLVGREGFILISPPVSPIYGQNPAFRVVTAGKDGQAADYATYYLSDLKTARGTAPGAWAKEYDFTQEWGGRQVDAASLHAVYDRVMKDAPAQTRWLTLLNVSSDAVHVPPIGAKALSCAMGNLAPAQYQECSCPRSLQGGGTIP